MTQHPAAERPDVIIVMTDEERAIPPYETDDVNTWRQRTLLGRRWFDENGVSFTRHYTGSLACVPSRPSPRSSSRRVMPWVSMCTPLMPAL